MPRLGGQNSRPAVLITGAARGLGEDLSRGLAASGYTVIGLARSEDALLRLAGEITATGGAFLPVTGDARDAGALDRAIALAESAPGGLYGVIANAGVAGPTAAIQDVSDDEWSETFDINVTSVFRLCKLSAPRLIERGAGRVVIIGSVTGKRPLPGRTPYAASKLALVGLARTLATELGPDGITVNVVSPWLLDGPRFDGVVAAQAELLGIPAEEVRTDLVSGTATRSTVSPDDVLASVEYLLDPRSRNITGQDINVSAGAVMY
ncbi:SDR family NAD(P)-dependent oxidoreductase [Leucobacter celer]|uniref:SDR family NAD(P)-dependent oxidoreductase n=1 Tax=Leucobacter celer TaxID=668625 RepID=UPI0006A7C953|nr:SDR family NAD(P)-dependent oxidoreductase [Leucobacter celer]